MKRRKVLKKMAATSMVGVAIASGPARATAENHRQQESKTEEKPHAHLQSEYERIDSVSESFKERTAGLVEELYEEDVLATTNYEQFSFNKDSSLTSDNSYVELSTTFDHSNSTPTAVIQVTEEIENGEVEFFVFPESEREYAIVSREDDESELKSTDENFSLATYSCDPCDPCQSSVFLSSGEECTDTRCDSRSENCCLANGICAPCTEYHYVKDEYQYYDCLGDGSDCPSEYGQRCLVRSYCDSDCCSDVGYGCDLCGASGCSGN